MARGILEEHFYHKTIQLYCGVFGSVFDEIRIERDDGKLIKVPIAYAIKKAYNVRNEQNPDPNSSRYKNQLPRMSFSIVGYRRDPSRMVNRYSTLIGNGNRTSGTVQVQKQRVPYNFQFRLNIKTKNFTDMLQIIEQIMVYFNPSVVANVEDAPDLGLETAIPIQLDSNDTLGDLFEGSFENEQIFETSLDFTLEGYLYMPTSNAKVIKKVTINYFDLDSREFIESDVFTEKDAIQK